MALTVIAVAESSRQLAGELVPLVISREAVSALVNAQRVYLESRGVDPMPSKAVLTDFWERSYGGGTYRENCFHLFLINARFGTAKGTTLGGFQVDRESFADTVKLCQSIAAVLAAGATLASEPAGDVH